MANNVDTGADTKDSTNLEKKSGEAASSTTWWVAILIALLGLLGSLGSSYLLSKKTAGDKVDEVLGANIVPIGSVLASLLSPAEFYRQAKIASPVFDPEKYTWVLADGRDVTRSAYEKLLPNHPAKVPDLRGRFLRGINESRPDYLTKGDPAGARSPGDDEPDALGAHVHTGSAATNVVDSGLALGWGSLPEHSAKVVPGVATVTVNQTGDIETRPRNSAVYWYVRIN